MTRIIRLGKAPELDRELTREDLEKTPEAREEERIAACFRRYRLALQAKKQK